MAAVIYGIVLISLPCMNALNVMKLLNELHEGFLTRHDNYQHTEVDLRAEQCGKPADVMFVIDSSGSISNDDFERQIKVGQIVHANGVNTRTNDALKVMRSEMFGTTNGARIDVSKICILLTDGQSNNEALTLEEATLAKQQGIKILAIGIGEKVKDAELEAVVSPPAQANYFKTSFANLQSAEFRELIEYKACEGH